MNKTIFDIGLYAWCGIILIIAFLVGWDLGGQYYEAQPPSWYREFVRIAIICLPVFVTLIPCYWWLNGRDIEIERKLETAKRINAKCKQCEHEFEIVLYPPKKKHRCEVCNSADFSVVDSIPITDDQEPDPPS